ncbi:hypothetical protein [Helicobacter sp. 23-1045]
MREFRLLDSATRTGKRQNFIDSANYTESVQDSAFLQKISLLFIQKLFYIFLYAFN